MQVALVFLVSICGLLVQPKATHAAALGDVEQLAALPFIASVSVSPNGRYIAARQAVDGRYTVAIYDLESSDPPAAWPLSSNAELLNFGWIAEDRLIVEVMSPHPAANLIRMSATGPQADAIDPTVIDVHITDPELRDHFGLYHLNLPFRFVPGTTSVVDYLWDDPDHALIAPINIGPRPLMRVNVRAFGLPEIVDNGTPTTQGWLADHDGNIRLRLDGGEGQVEIYLRDASQGPWRRILQSRPLEESVFLPITFDRAGQSIFVLSNHEGRGGLYRVDTAHPDRFARFFLPERVDATGAYFSDETYEPLAVAYIQDLTALHYLDPDFQRLNERLGRSIPGENVNIIETASRAPMDVVLASGPTTPHVYYLFNEETEELRPIGEAWPDLAGSTYGRVEAVRYETRDGANIDGYLTYPVGDVAGPLPMVVLPHGGPQSRDTMDFNPIAQMFARRGYLVFQMNFRGSVGYGLAFAQAGFGEWGGLMQNDVVDGINAMVERGIADPARLCMVGLSYGAYVALEEAVVRPSQYRCAAGIAGAYDLPRLLQAPQIQLISPFWSTSMGDLETNREYLEAVSPRRQVGGTMPPIFLAHGESDFTVPVSQTREMAETLANMGHPAEVHYFPESDHQFVFEPERIQMFRQLVDFVDRNLQN